jgi:hypothetical protein
VAVQHGEKEGRGVAPAKTAESRGGGGATLPKRGRTMEQRLQIWCARWWTSIVGGQMAPGSVRDDNGCSVLGTFTRMKEVE